MRAISEDGSEDSLRRRYAYKLGISVGGLPIGVLVQAIVPRMLGPAAYGDYSFLTTFFSQVVAFFDMGLSSAFYSKLSQRQREGGLLWFFAGVAALLTLLVGVAVLAVFVLGMDERLWPHQGPAFVWFAAGWGLLAWYGMTVNKVTDAYGLTVPSEIVRFLQKLLGLVLILLLFRFGSVGLTGFFLFQYVLLVVLLFGWWAVLKRGGHDLLPGAPLSSVEIAGYLREFYGYSAPLFAFQVVGLVGGVADRWLLQRFAGSVEQGYFALSYQVGALCFLMSGAMVPLFWRDLAKAHGAGNQEVLRAMFRRFVPLLYSVAALMAVFVALQADKVSTLLGGVRFRGAVVPIAIMAFYPVHQTYGQLNSAFLMATGQTRLYRNLGVVGLAFQLLTTFWMLAPARWHGLGLGATGLALSMVVAQVVGVNLQLWFISRFLRLRFHRFIAHQFYAVGVLAATAWVSARFVDGLVLKPFWALGVSGALYVCCCVALVFLLPSLVALSRADLLARTASAWRLCRAHGSLPC